MRAELDSIPDEEVRIIPDVEWNGAEFETVEIPAELDVDTANFSSAYDAAIEHIPI